MRKRLVFLLILTLLACQTLSPGGVPVESPVPPTRTSDVSQTPVPETETAIPTLTATPEPTPTLVLPTIAPLHGVSESDFAVRTHPDGGLYVGDVLSFEVIAPEEVDLEGSEIQVSFGEQVIGGPVGFSGFGIGGRFQATFRFVWDTSALEAGVHEITFSINPGGLEWTEPVVLLPESMLVFPEPESTWTTAESDCCVFYYLTDTPSARDIQFLMDTADAEAELAIEQIGREFDEPIEIVFLPRVLGHGGFAGGEIYISYLDRNYAGNAAAQVLHHELIHILDGRAGGDFRPTLFVEGLAVYWSGGHFKKEPIVPRAAALLDLDTYLPLEPLSNDFYFQQHEISYLQAAALIQFMIEQYGYDAFDSFYRDIQRIPDSSDAESIDSALQASFDITFAELESEFIAYLSAQPKDPELSDDIRLTVMFYDTVRRYQQVLDTSAYFLTAWLIDIEEALENSITADFLRHPAEAENLALETMLVAADAALRRAEYSEVEDTLIAVNAVLESFENGDSAANPFYADPLAADYLALVHTTLDAGYTPQIIELNENAALVLATRDSVNLVELEFVRGADDWVSQ